MAHEYLRRVESAIVRAGNPPAGCSDPLAWNLGNALSADRDLRPVFLHLDNCRKVLSQDVFVFPLSSDPAETSARGG